MGLQLQRGIYGSEGASGRAPAAVRICHSLPVNVRPLNLPPGGRRTGLKGRWMRVTAVRFRRNLPVNGDLFPRAINNRPYDQRWKSLRICRKLTVIRLLPAGASRTPPPTSHKGTQCEFARNRWSSHCIQPGMTSHVPTYQYRLLHSF